MANTSINFYGLDFLNVKDNLKNYLKGQDILKDYNFEGSVLSVLLDVLSYNTQYNAFYLNMVANEMFLDSALQRASVISHAKLLNYTPRSYVAPTAIVDIVVSNVSSRNLTLPQYSKFASESIQETNYSFLSQDTITTDVVNGVATFKNVLLRQGNQILYTFTVDSSTNPGYRFELPDNQIDIGTLKVTVRQSISDTNYDVYKSSDDYLLLDGNDKVYFIQEFFNGNYEIIFGDGILGKKLSDGNIIVVSGITTQGKESEGANNFAMVSVVPEFVDVVVYGVVAASFGQDKESIDSIKFQAPKSYAAQKRAVTKNDYVTLINQRVKNVSFDSVNVWGGEENIPPIYGKVFISIKPAGYYQLTLVQKQKILEDILKPISLVTVVPELVDPDYTFITLTINVIYDPAKTNLTESELQFLIKEKVLEFSENQLNTYNSVFLESDLTNQIKQISFSILGSDVSIRLQKKFYPDLTVAKTYNFYYGTKLQRGVLTSGVSSYPYIKIRDPNDLSNIVTGVFIEETPQLTFGVEKIDIVNSGYGYLYPPTITIQGDGSGATATSEINTNGQITKINVTNAGNNYTSAYVTVTPKPDDTQGFLGVAKAVLQGRYGKLRLYYYNGNVKTIINDNLGIIDYENGIITLNDFNPYDVDNGFGQLFITTTPVSSLVYSEYNRILSIDPFDPTAISVNLIPRASP